MIKLKDTACMWIFLNTKNHDEVNLIIVFFWTFSLGNDYIYCLKSEICVGFAPGEGGGGTHKKNWIGVCGPLPKTLTLFMTWPKILYPIYDLIVSGEIHFKNPWSPVRDQSAWQAVAECTQLL